LIAFFSWGGNTRGIAEEIRKRTGADLFEIELATPYSGDYGTALNEAQRAKTSGRGRNWPPT
jgi:flavodoxin